MSTDRHDLTLLDTYRSSFTASLRYISIAKYDSDWNSTLHAHSCAELFYILRGSGNFQVESRSFPISAGDLVFVGPLVRHTESGTEGRPLEYLVLGVERLELLDTPENPEHCRLLRPQDYSEEVRSCLQNLHREMEGKAPGFEEACCHLTELLAIRLLRRSDFVPGSDDGDQNVSKESAMVRRYIDNHFKEHIDLDQLSRVAHLNKYHLSHTFRREYGISPISYLLSLRIRESKRLLRSTDLSLAQIAQITGFSSPSYFSQSFRKAADMSPAQYRAQAKQITPNQTEEEFP